MCKRVVYWGSALAAVLALVLVLTMLPAAVAQETTGGLQGTVKDPSGAVVPGALVVVTSTALVGKKELVTDSSGYYRFANLPPGIYNVAVSAKGFRTLKREGMSLEVGHLPTVDFALELGATTEVVEVTSAAPTIDVTTTQNLSNVTNDVIANIPHGLSFQSVIQFAPMARNEPLAGASINGMGSGGTGGSLPGSSGNGSTYGFSIGGAADSESTYLVEGQDTENNSGGYSKANVPFQFIQEVEIKTSGIEAEHGGALGGVINVIMKKGSNAYHGELFATYEPSGVDANPTNAYLRYNPLDSGVKALGQDPGAQLYQASKDHYRILQPGFTVGGPIVKDRLWFYTGFAPQVNSLSKTVNFGSKDGNAGNQYFTQDRQTYYGTARLDASLTQKIRLYGSWLYQYARETGNSLPISDSGQAGYLNASTNSPLTNFSHGLGWAAPNSTYNVGADISLTPKIVATTRFGYFFENYHDFGWPTTAPNVLWNTSGAGAFDNSNTPAGCTVPTPNTCTGNPLPAALAQAAGTSTTPYLGSFTLFNANKHYQFDQDVAFFKGGLWGTHNIKIGYQLNHLTNVIDQNGNVPQVFLNLGRGNSHFAFTNTGTNNCATVGADWANGACAGLYGLAVVQDFSTILTKPASDYNHAFFAQDSWNVGHGLTFTLGIRIEKEYLPAPAGYTIKSINFDWSDKVEPRLGAAWDPTGHGKMKLFGSYGVVNDVMKLLVAQTSWGAQSFEQCIYALGPDGTPAGFSASDLNLIYKQGRACPNGPATTQANFASGTTPPGLADSKSGVSLIENINLRPWEPVAPGVKPYRQHEYVAGWDYQISRDWAFEARYDRRRLDHVIEDASLADPAWGETYTIVNPGEGVNKTLDGYAAFLTSLGQDYGVPGWAFNAGSFGAPKFGTCPTCPANPKAIRNYDGLELRLTKAQSKGWSGSFSYTWSSLWGNYTGLTTTDQIDGGSTGRNSPDTTRAFDQPFYYFGANGKSNDGPLPTDRPNTFKGYVYYQLSWGKGQTTTFGLFQSAYQGSPVSSYIDLAAMPFGQLVAEATYIYGRGKWVNMTTDANGNITVGTPYDRRTPWFTQSDFNIGHRIKVGEHQSIGFEASAFNLLNQRSVTAFYQGMNSVNFQTPLVPAAGLGLSSGAALYQTLESGYNPQTWINGNGGAVSRVIKSSWYGQPFLYQNARSIRFTMRYTF
ncbi:MAG: carboxypeptidase regulatory-like domain-containing protein [Candidatus Acidiferrales bacterium]